MEESDAWAALSALIVVCCLDADPLAFATILALTALALSDSRTSYVPKGGGGGLISARSSSVMFPKVETPRRHTASPADISAAGDEPELHSAEPEPPPYESEEKKDYNYDPQRQPPMSSASHRRLMRALAEEMKQGR